MGSLNDVLARASLFAHLDATQRASVVEVLRPQRLPKGEHLYRQGGNGDAAFVIVSGALARYREERDGARVPLGTARSGEVLGVSSWLDPARRRSTVRAETDSLVYVLDHQAAAELRAHDPSLVTGLLRGLARVMAGRLRDTQTKLRSATGAEPAATVADQSPAAARPWSHPVEWTRIPTLRRFDRRALAPLLTAAPAVCFRDGAWLCRRGEQGETAFIVVGGSLAVLDERAGGDRVLTVLSSGTFACQLALLGSMPYAASIRAQGDAGALAIDRRAFERLLDQGDLVAAALLEEIAIACVRQLHLSAGVTSELRARQRAQRLARHPLTGAARSAPSAPSGSARSERGLDLWSHREPPRAPASPPAAEPPAAEPPAVEATFVERALGRVGMSLEDLDQVEVAKLDGVISAAELKARRGG